MSVSGFGLTGMIFGSMAKINLPRDANGKLGLEAVIPPNINTRRVSLREGSKIVTVEVI